VPQQFANSRRTAWHAMFEPKSVYGPKLVGRKHYLQPFFPRQTALSLTILHDTLHEQVDLGKFDLYITYSFLAILFQCEKWV
jgi:hypothetical protein